MVIDRAFVSSVRLQVLLYFSCYYDLVFCICHIIVGGAKFQWIRGPYIIAITSVNYVLIFVLEPCRLYLGYAGNLGEQVPELFLFVVLCLVNILILAVELALCAVLVDLQPEHCSQMAGRQCVFYVEKACWIVRIGFLAFEFLFGFLALRRLIQEQSARFFVSLEADGIVQEGASGGDGAQWATGPDGRPGRRGSEVLGGAGLAARVYGRPHAD